MVIPYHLPPLCGRDNFQDRKLSRDTFGFVQYVGGMEKPNSSPETTPKILITLPELSRRYSLSRQTIRRAIKAGGFLLFDCGTAWPRVRVSDIEAWISSTQIKQRNPDETPKAAA